MIAVSVKNLSIHFNGVKVIENLTFDIPVKSISAIIGPNGCGKTTLIKAILGLIPYSGSVSILNKKPSEILKKIGYVPQRFTFEKTFPITIKEFLELEHRGHKNVNRKILEKLNEVGMSSTHNKLLGQLSGGQLQRVLIAKALLNEPEILFLDEPAAGVDIKGERNFFELLKHLNKDHGVTIVFISHEVDIVHKYATQVLCLNKKLICIGKPHDILTDKTLKELYDINITLYKHDYQKHD
ncbi:metal ABC transporter ATP-binding protein [Patescibacteria group bacterium]